MCSAEFYLLITGSPLCPDVTSSGPRLLILKPQIDLPGLVCYLCRVWGLPAASPCLQTHPLSFPSPVPWPPLWRLSAYNTRHTLVTSSTLFSTETLLRSREHHFLSYLLQLLKTFFKTLIRYDLLSDLGQTLSHSCPGRSCFCFSHQPPLLLRVLVLCNLRVFSRRRVTLPRTLLCYNVTLMHPGAPQGHSIWHSRGTFCVAVHSRGLTVSPCSLALNAFSFPVYPLCDLEHIPQFLCIPASSPTLNK